MMVFGCGYLVMMNVNGLVVDLKKINLYYFKIIVGNILEVK